MEDCEGGYDGSTWPEILNLIPHSGCMSMVIVAKSAFNSSLLHNFLGHMNVKGVKMLAAKGVLEGLKFVDMGPCEICVMSKQKQVSFTKASTELNKMRLGVVHTDV